MGPTSRRYLLHDLKPESLGEYIRGYEKLFPDGAQTYKLAVHRPWGGWLMVEVPPDLPLAHFHNLGKWFEGHTESTAVPDKVLTLSHGEDAWEYWLVPCEVRGWDHILTGASGKGRNFQIDCSTNLAFDDARLQVAPLTSRLALMTRDVHAALHSPNHGLKPIDHIEIRLPPPEAEEWSFPPSANLADAIELTEPPPEGIGVLLDRIANFFKRD